MYFLLMIFYFPNKVHYCVIVQLCLNVFLSGIYKHCIFIYKYRSCNDDVKVARGGGGHLFFEGRYPLKNLQPTPPFFFMI